MRLASAFLFLSLAACAGDEMSSQESLTRTPYECGDVEVHVFGVDDARSYDGPGEGDGTTILLKRPGRHILVLSSRLANTWNVKVEGEAKLEGVYAVGHEPQRVNTNVRTKINLESGMTGGAEAWGYQYPAKDTNALLKLASIRVARHPTSFHGCKAASYFEVGENMLTSSDCPEASYTQYDAVLDCDGDNTCGADQDDDGDSGDGTGDGSLY